MITSKHSSACLINYNASTPLKHFSMFLIPCSYRRPSRAMRLKGSSSTRRNRYSGRISIYDKRRSLFDALFSSRLALSPSSHLSVDNLYYYHCCLGDSAYSKEWSPYITRIFLLNVGPASLFPSVSWLASMTICKRSGDEHSSGLIWYLLLMVVLGLISSND